MIPLIIWIQEYQLSILDVRHTLSKMEKTLLNMKKFEFKDFLGYIMWMINELGKFANKGVRGFRLNSLIKLSDARSQKEKEITVTRFLTEKLLNSRPDIITIIKDSFQLCGEVLREITKISTLLPNATQKLFDIHNMLKRKDISSEFLHGMTPFAASLRSDLLGINKQLEGIDKQIFFFAGIIYDNNVYKDKPTIKEITSTWTSLKANKILEESEIVPRIKRESERYAFFNELYEAFKTLIEGENFLLEKKLELEKQQRMQERKEKAEKIRKEKEEARRKTGEVEESTIDVIKANIIEERDMALSYEKLLKAKMQWRKVFTLTKITGMVRSISEKRTFEKSNQLPTTNFESTTKDT